MSQAPDATDLGPDTLISQLEQADLAAEQSRAPPYGIVPWGDAQPAQTRWHVEQVLPEGVCSIVGAEMKTGKTWVLLSMALAMAQGGRWLGWRCEQRSTLVFSPEGSAGALARRLHRLCWGMQLDPTYAAQRVHVMNARTFNLADTGLQSGPDGAVTAVPRTLDRMLRTIEQVRPDVIILDPLINLYSGIPENDAGIKDVLDAIRAMLIKPHMSVLVAHHINKMHANHSAFHALRGHSSIGGWTDGLIALRRRGDSPNDPRTLQVWHRDDRSPAPLLWRLVDLPGDVRNGVTAIRLDTVDDPEEEM